MNKSIYTITDEELIEMLIQNAGDMIRSKDFNSPAWVSYNMVRNEVLRRMAPEDPKKLKFQQLNKDLFDYQSETGNMASDFINDLFPKTVSQRRRGIIDKEEYDNTMAWIEEISFREE